MKSVVGVFKSQADAERAATAIHSAGVPQDKINLLSPSATLKQVESVPTTDAEPPGMGKAFGATVGGTIGLAGGFWLGPALATVLLPGIGAITAVGATAAAILGVLGAVGGGAAGRAADAALSDGIPEDELFVYEDALRQGRTVLIAAATDDAHAATIREILTSDGAETVDKARHMWWLGIRGAEKSHYDSHGGIFDRDEAYYQRGFEAALHINHRGKSYEDSRDQLGWLYPDAVDQPAFRHGFDRGQVYLKTHIKA
ncbi:MAG: hypothetical protein WCA98_11590 [Candidatus Acidiferrales bacterium]